jgi:lipopolysaccharide biosynthesis glycosyltransferase
MDNIPIVFSVNDFYVPYMASAMQSIMENANRNRRYSFFVLHLGIDTANIELLKTQIGYFPQFSIEFINAAKYIQKYNFFVSRNITVEAYLRLLIPELLSEYHKVIYLDGDMICRVDIASLFDIDLENNLLAAVRDTGVSWYYSPNHTAEAKKICEVLLNLKKPDEYFCDAMIVLNTDLFKKTISTDKLLQLAESREWQVHDQDVLNYVAEGKTLLLPFYWNFMQTAYAKYLPNHLRKDYLKAEKNPLIIHYKPWNSESYTPFFYLFWQYAPRTPFINVIIERMKDKELINTLSLQEKLLDNITRRKGIGIKFILFDCIKAWLFREKRK